MFAKGTITQSMIDAVNSVISEEKKQMLMEPELDETGFHKAAHAAKKAGQSHFEFQGKKYPATAKSHKEAIEIEEASEKVPTPTGMKVYGSSYGNSKKARADQTKHSVDDVKEPKAKDLKTEEQHDDEKEDKKLIKKMVDKSCLKQESSFANKLLDTIKEHKDSGSQETFTDNNLGEEEMSDAQMKKREKIVMSMKKGAADLKQRYGKNWKNVMYATATKQAMKEDSSDVYEGEELDEATPPKGTDIADKSYLKTAGKKPGTMHNVGKGLKAFLQGKKEPMESVEYDGKSLEEKNDSHTHAAHYEDPKTGEWTGMKLIAAKDDQDAIKQAHANCEDGCRLSKVQRHTTVKEDFELTEAEVVVKSSDLEEVTTDMLRGREKGGKSNSFKPIKLQLRTDGEMKSPAPEHGMDTKEKQKITTNPGPVDIETDDKLGKPTPQSHFSDKKKLNSEAVRGELKHIRNKEGKMRDDEVDSFAKDQKQSGLIKNEESELDEKVIAGTPGWEKMPKDVKDKSGAVHTPMSRAKDLARQAFKKVKQETMMGKISN